VWYALYAMKTPPKMKKTRWTCLDLSLSPSLYLSLALGLIQGRRFDRTPRVLKYLYQIKERNITLDGLLSLFLFSLPSPSPSIARSRDKPRTMPRSSLAGPHISGPKEKKENIPLDELVSLSLFLSLLLSLSLSLSHPPFPLPLSLALGLIRGRRLDRAPQVFKYICTKTKQNTEH